MPWVIFARASPPDAAIWPGRRVLAFVDAVVWPVWPNKGPTSGSIIGRDLVNFMYLPAVTVPMGILQYDATRREPLTLNVTGRLYDDANAYLGRLLMELHRAGRLVVDTGLHEMGWTREKAMEWFITMEGTSPETARRAVERYMAWPGQALAYKVGELKLIELRERARAKLGARFDIRAFHTQVLGEGSMPLQMLEEKIDAWIASR